MRRFGSLGLAVAAAFAVVLFADRARADIVLYDKDGWGFYTRGQVAAFYQLALGDSDPTMTAGSPIGGTFNSLSLSNQQNNQVTLSRVRSGYIGTQIGFGIRRDLSETVHVDSLMAVSLQDISGGRNVGAPEGVDFREAWASLVTPYGSFKFGRMYSIFGSASTDVMLLAYRYGIGNPCYGDTANIACGSVGAGVLFAGYNAELRYITPRLAGFQAQLSVGDPISGQVYSFTLTPLPRFDGEINYDQHFGDTTRLRVIAQGLTQELQRNKTGQVETSNVWGAMGSGIFEAGGFAVGAGLWEGSGIGTESLFYLAPGSNDSVSFDSSGELRLFRGYYGNIAYDYHGSRLAAGTGITYVRPTAQDISPGGGNVDILDHAAEWHVVFTQKIDAIVLDAEYARWTTRWHDEAHETMNFVAVGANFNW
jgi:predicted porin